ncbi:MAG: hypothetical protein ACHQ2Y_09315 [Candidatus Lutacidiplasmatales archaeon]
MAAGGAAVTGVPTTTGGPAASSGLDPGVIAALVQILQSPMTSQAQQAQQLLLQRLVLEGDIVPSRIPPPQNITEVGGYINLLTTLSQNRLREEMLASALGIAPPLSFLEMASGHPLAMIPLTNDRPTATALQATVPLSIQVRSDFSAGLSQALSALHSQGGLLPLVSPAAPLPPAGPATTPPTDWLPYIGREMGVMPTVALINPATDPIILASASGSAPFTLYAASAAAPVPASPALQAVAWNGNSLQTSPVTVGVVNLDLLLAQAGWIRPNTASAPASPSDGSWAVLINITSLVPGSTTLGSELSLLYSANDVGSSGAAAFVSKLWNGTAFA